MNPDILRTIAEQQGQDARARAHRQRTVRTLARALRSGRRHTVESDGLAAVRVPDYVDGSFRADQPASKVPAGRTAA